MEIRLILFKEIGFGISLNNRANQFSVRRLPYQKEESRRTILPSSSKPDLHFAEVQL
jgi:hypothetical protein